MKYLDLYNIMTTYRCHKHNYYKGRWGYNGLQQHHDCIDIGNSIFIKMKEIREEINNINEVDNIDIENEREELQKNINTLFYAYIGFILNSTCITKYNENNYTIIDKILDYVTNIIDNKEFYYKGRNYKLMDILFLYIPSDEIGNSIIDKIININDKIFNISFAVEYIKTNLMINSVASNNLNKHKSMINRIKNFVLKECKNDDFSFVPFVEMRCPYFANIISNIIDKHDGDIKEDVLIGALRFLPYTKSIVNSLILKLKPEFKESYLSVVLNYCEIEGIKYFIGRYKNNITSNNFEKLLCSHRYIDKKGNCTDEYGFYVKTYYDKSTVIGYNTDKFELLVENGFKPTYNDIITALKYKVELPNIERFDIKLEQNFIKECEKYKFFPSYEIKGVGKNISELRSLCTIKNKSQITSFFKRNKKDNIVPDRICMENASEIKTNKAVLDVLISHGGKITAECVEKNMRVDKYSIASEYIVTNFIKEYRKEVNEYKEKIKQYEEKIKRLKINKNLNDVIDPISDNDKEDNEIEIGYHNEDSYDEISDEEIDDGETNDSENSGSDIEQVEEEEEEDIELYDFEDIPSIDKSKKKIINGNVLKLLNSKAKSLSFIDLKKLVLKYIYDNSLFDGEIKYLIKLDSGILDILDFDKDDNTNIYLHFNDFDKFVYQFYKIKK